MQWFSWLLIACCQLTIFADCTIITFSNFKNRGSKFAYMANIIDIKIPKAIATALRIPPNDARRQQIRVLKKLLRKARFTEFGQKYHFDDVLLSKHPGKKFQELVPVHDYNKIYEEWWKKTLEGVPDVTWPGKIKYYALSSGTSESASKYIPVTKDLLRSNSVNYIRQLISVFGYEEANRKALTKGFGMPVTLVEY
jgi:hypothetical protein